MTTNNKQETQEMSGSTKGSNVKINETHTETVGKENLAEEDKLTHASEWEDIAGAATDKTKETLKEGAEKGGEALKTGTDQTKETLKEGAEKLGEFVKEGAEKLGELTTQAVQATKMKIEEHHLKSERDKQFQSVGEKLWQHYQAQKLQQLSDVDKLLAEDFRKITEIEKALKEERTGKEASPAK